MRPNMGVLRIPVRSDGFVVLFPPPDHAVPPAPSALARAGLLMPPDTQLLHLSEARLHRIQCFRLSPMAEVALRPAENTVLVACGHGRAGEGRGGEGMVLDGARADNALVLPARKEALLLALPRGVLEALARQRLPLMPPMALWPRQASLGAADSAFAMLVAYLMRLIAECPERTEQEEMGAQLEEALALELIRNWGQPVQPPSSAVSTGIVPRHVRVAESYMAAHAAASPAIAEVARASGVSERVLSAAFRRFRGMTPSAYLRELRLCGVRAALETAERGDTVASVAASWSYVNFGLFARAYANRFGELPSVTMRRARGG